LYNKFTTDQKSTAASLQQVIDLDLQQVCKNRNTAAKLYHILTSYCYDILISTSMSNQSVVVAFGLYKTSAVGSAFDFECLV